MIVILLIGVLAGAGVLVLVTGGRSLWWPALGLSGFGLLGAVAVMVAMESATLAQLETGEVPSGVIFGGLAVVVSISGLVGLALLGLLRIARGAKQGGGA